MGKINWGRVFLGGLLAGVVVNVFEFVTNGIVLASNWEAAMRSLGRQMPKGAIAIFLLVGFLVGITAVWLYAAARPRYGPGPRTAVCIGVAYWLIGYAIPTLGWAAMGLVPRRLLAIGTAVGLVEMVAATLVGTWPYKERQL